MVNGPYDAILVQNSAPDFIGRAPLLRCDERRLWMAMGTSREGKL